MLTILSVFFYVVAIFFAALFGASGEEWQHTLNEAHKRALLSDATFYLFIVVVSLVAAVLIQVYS